MKKVFGFCHVWRSSSAELTSPKMVRHIDVEDAGRPRQCRLSCAEIRPGVGKIGRAGAETRAHSQRQVEGTKVSFEVISDTLPAFQVHLDAHRKSPRG